MTHSFPTRRSSDLEQAKPIVVAQGEDLIALREGPTGEDNAVVAEVALVPQHVPGPAVEVIHIRQASSDHQRVLAAHTGVHPLIHQPVPYAAVSAGLVDAVVTDVVVDGSRSEEHTSELQSLMRTS